MEKFRALLKSKALMYILLALFCMLLACLSKDYDYDLYARLIVGEHLVETGEFLYEDFLSYTPTHLWFDHEWGSSVVFYLFFKYFGVLGFILVQALTMFVTAVFVMKTQSLQKHAYPASLAFMALFLMMFSHLNPSLVRCHMFSFMFFAIFLYLLEKTRRFNSNLIWIIPPIVILWNNLHGGVVSGMGMIFIYMVGAILSRKPWRKYFYVLLVSTPLLAINPYGAEYFNFLISANTKTRKFITEWWGVFVQRHVMYYYPAFCAAIFTIALLFTKRKHNITRVMALLVTGVLGIIHVKLLSITLIVIASLFYNDLIRLVSKNSLRFLEKTAYTLVFLALFYIPYTNPSVAKVKISKFPVTEVEFIKTNKLEGNLLTAFGLGSYASYKLYPQNLIYMDGRYEEVYYDREFDALMDYESLNEDWQKILYEYPTEILMPEKIVPVYKELQKSSEWDEIYTGNVCGIFVRKENNKGNYKKPNLDIKYYQKTAFDNFGCFGKSKEGENCE